MFVIQSITSIRNQLCLKCSDIDKYQVYCKIISIDLVRFVEYIITPKHDNHSKDCTII